MVSANEAHCELTFSPNVNLIGIVRRFVGEFYVQVLGDADMTSRLVVATHELLENAVRYSSDGQTRIRIGVGHVGEASRVSIETRNMAGAAHRTALAELIGEMRAATDPALFYQGLMRRSAKRTTGSGLGLGRIFSELELDLSCEIEGNAVLLRAQATVPTGGVSA